MIAPFVAEYAAARTPIPASPATAASGSPSFSPGGRAGCDLVGDGPLRAGRRVPRAGAALLRGVDPERTSPTSWPRCLARSGRRVVFPLGWSTKAAVRAAARALDLPVADKPESQEICFVPDGDRGFLFPAGQAERPGPIVDADGRALGSIAA